MWSSKILHNKLDPVKMEKYPKPAENSEDSQPKEKKHPS